MTSRCRTLSGSVSRVQQCSIEETLELAPAELSERKRQRRPLPDGPDKTVGSFRTNHDWSHGHMHYAGGCSRFNIEATPCGISTGRMTPPVTVVRGQPQLLL